MGQSQSTCVRLGNRGTMPLKELRSFLTEENEKECGWGGGDISILPDACLAFIFQFLGPRDRKRCSLVCRHWLKIEGQTRHRLSLNAQFKLLFALPYLFSRFDSVTELTLKCHRESISIDDQTLILISVFCKNLKRFKIRSCRQVTDLGIATFARNCNTLKSFSCGSCNFGAKGIKAVLINCSALEELSVKRLRGITNDPQPEPIGPGVAASSLKYIYLKDLYNAQCFGPLLMGSINLIALKLFRCSGDWDRLLELVTERVHGLVEVHLERLHVSDAGLAALSRCHNLAILRLIKTPDCSNSGLISVAEKCKLLRWLHIEGWKTNRITDEGLIAVSKYCPDLEELVLVAVNSTRVSLQSLATNCQKLERLALCGSDTIGDDEMSCIAEKCNALRNLFIKSCPVSDHGLVALAAGCPNLEKIRVKECIGVTAHGAGWFRDTRHLLDVGLDIYEVESQDAASDGDVAVQNPPPPLVEAATNGGSSITSRLASFKARLAACAFRKWSSFRGGASPSD